MGTSFNGAIGTIVSFIFERPARTRPEQFAELGVPPRRLHLLGQTLRVLFITKAEVLYWTASPNDFDRSVRYVNEGWLRRGQLTARAIAARHAGFLTELDLFTLDELDQEPFYRDYLRPLGMGWGVGMVLPIPSGKGQCMPCLEAPFYRDHSL